jgi:hypothetical protein
MRRSAFARSIFVAASLALATPVLADERGENEYDRAMELHRAKRWDDAAFGFAAAYEAGYREDAAAYNTACALARGGHVEEALLWLQEARYLGFDLEDYLDDDDDLRSLRGDPRFLALRQAVLGGKPSKRDREGERLVQRLASLKVQGETRSDKYDDVGRELLRTGRYEESARAFETAAAREDDPATSLYNAACARSLQGQSGAALSLLRSAVEAGFTDAKHIDEDDDLDNIRRDPRFAQIRALAVELDTPPFNNNWRERDGKNLREWQQALPRIDAAARRYPNLGLAWYNVAMSRLAINQPAQAVQPFERAIALKYRVGTSTYNLACALALSGNKDQAFAALDRAFASGFDNWWLVRQDEDLDSLRTDPRFGKYVEMARRNGKDWH